MIEILEKLKSIVHSLEGEHGPILVFALFLREDPLEKWDIVVSAKWLNSSDRTSFETIASKIQKSLNASELMQLSRIVILDTDDPVVAFLQNTAMVTNGSHHEVPGGGFSDRFGFTIKRAYLLRCQKYEDSSDIKL
jgi:hypothetical protein